MEMMKERFAKLLLGEDMSGSGKGVSTALAVSNAITNLSGTSILLSLCLFCSEYASRTLITRGFVGPSPQVPRGCVHTSGLMGDHVTNCHA